MLRSRRQHTKHTPRRSAQCKFEPSMHVKSTWQFETTLFCCASETQMRAQTPLGGRHVNRTIPLSSPSGTLLHQRRHRNAASSCITSKSTVVPFARPGEASRKRTVCQGAVAPQDMDQDPSGITHIPTSGNRSHETDYVIIGSGIGGLCCAAMLARYGYRVTVCESHYLPGGAAHSFQVKGYTFDAGPSFFVGLSSKPGTSPNPLKQVLDVVGENIECKQYDRWIVYTQDGTFPCVAGRQAYLDNIRRQGGQEALNQWLQLEKLLEPLQKGAALFPAAAIRSDLGIALTSLRFLGPDLLATGLVANQLTGPFSAVVDKVVTNKWLRAFLDLECFVLSGMPAKDTICAEMAFMFMERNSGKSAIDYPMGGSGAIIDALIRGIKKYGGRVLLSSHVEQVVMEGGKAAGVKLRPQPGSSTSSKGVAGPEVIKARMGVISNASCWDTQRLLPPGAAPAEWQRAVTKTQPLDSMVHLHLGIDATGLPADLDCHHLVVNDWYKTTEHNNVCIASIPTVFDPSMAPPGKATVHAYFAGNEPYEPWQGLDRRSPEYKELKRQRAEPLWKALERFIPDIRDRAELTLIGTPLTHERFLRRHRGTYGAGISAGQGETWPGPKTPVPGLYQCGDSTMPGIGVPAAAASGLMCANTLAPVWSHLGLMDQLVPSSK